MIYSYQKKNKFKHLLLDLNLSFSGGPGYEDRKKWLRKNIGCGNKKWIVNYGYHIDGKKVYQRNFNMKNGGRQKFYEEVSYVIQWSFQDKDDALAFILVWC